MDVVYLQGSGGTSGSGNSYGSSPLVDLSTKKKKGNEIRVYNKK